MHFYNKDSLSYIFNLLFRRHSLLFYCSLAALGYIVIGSIHGSVNISFKTKEKKNRKKSKSPKKVNHKEKIVRQSTIQLV
jgi:hypothetical protein